MKTLGTILSFAAAVLTLVAYEPESVGAVPPAMSNYIFTARTVEIVRDETPARWNDQLVTTLTKGRRFGVVRDAADLVEIRVCVSDGSPDLSGGCIAATPHGSSKLAQE